MLVCYGTEALWSQPPSERTIGIPNGSSLQYENHYAEQVQISGKYENIAFFFQLEIWVDIYVVFIRPSHFLSAKPIKPIVFKNSGYSLKIAELTLKQQSHNPLWRYSSCHIHHCHTLSSCYT